MISHRWILDLCGDYAVGSSRLKGSLLLKMLSLRRCLPPVPNLVAWTCWLKTCICQGIPSCFHGRCSFKTIPPCFAYAPHFLPDLSEVGPEESTDRVHYWLPFLMCGPIFMTLLCELVRRSFLRMTTRSWACLPQSKSGDDDAGGKMQMGQTTFSVRFFCCTISFA